MGRNDLQVKVRGQRIELGEIEAVLRAQSEVAAGAVAVVSDQLVGYVVPAGEPDLQGLRSALGEALPGYMVPSQFVVVEALPLLPNGKLDRRALPEPTVEEREFRAPGTDTEQTVASVFAEVLGVERVGLDDDFFALGGNSLVATQVVSRLGAALGVRVPLRALFDAPTVEDLAARLEEESGAGIAVPLIAQERPDVVPLSLAQQRMWFLNRLDPDSAVNNIPAAIRLSGILDVEALKAAVKDLIVRHEILRTVYPEIDGVGHQVVLDVDGSTPALTIVETTETDLFGEVANFMGSGFDVTAAPPLRLELLRLSETEHVLVVVVHHIAADGFSMGPLARDVMLAYAACAAGEIPAWTPLEVQYADYALWQRRVLGSEDDPDSLISRQLSFWTEALTDAPDVLDLPTDRPRPAVTSYRGATHRFELSDAVRAGIDEVARERGLTPFMVVHGALAVVLARWSGSDDIAIGTPVAGRGERALDDLIGMFVNTLVLRTQVDTSESFVDLLGRVREVDLGAFGHADVPFERLVEVLDPVRSTAWNPLFQVMLTLQNFEPTSFELPGLSLSAVDADAQWAKFDLQVTLSPQADRSGLDAEITYATDLFDHSTIVTLAGCLERMLSAVVLDPTPAVGDIDMFGADELERVLVLGHGSPTSVDEVTVPDLIAAQVVQSPDAAAVSDGSTTWTYRKFEERIGRLARHLISLGVGPEVRVAVAMDRSLDLVLSVCAVLAAGGATCRSIPNSRMSGSDTSSTLPPSRWSWGRPASRYSPDARSRRSTHSTSPNMPPDRFRTVNVVRRCGHRTRRTCCSPRAPRAGPRRRGDTRVRGQPARLDAGSVRHRSLGFGAAQDTCDIRRVGVGTSAAFDMRSPVGGRVARRTPRPRLSRSSTRGLRYHYRAVRADRARCRARRDDRPDTGIASRVRGW